MNHAIKIAASQPPYFALYAETLVDNGYNVVAVRPKEKVPRYKRWQTASFKPPEPSWLEHHVRTYPTDSIGIACGSVIGVDIDENDPARAHEIYRASIEMLGDTPLIRVGRWPKRLLLYRANDVIDTARGSAIEILARGSQFVAFGIHPDIGRPYYWIDGSPAETDAADLPAVRREGLRCFLLRVSNLAGRNSAQDTRAGNDNARQRTPAIGDPFARSKLIERNAAGIVTEGREEFLRGIVWEEYHKGYQSPEELAKRAWSRFATGADLTRPKGKGTRRWAYRDATTKAKQICRRLPVRRYRRLSINLEHLHGYRVPDYWDAERKAAHQSEATKRAMTPASLVVNRKMLDETNLATGQCAAPVSVLIKATNLSESAVKTARRELCRAGLWIAERGVYVPVAVGEGTIEGVQTELDPLYRSVDAPLAPGSAFNGNDADEKRKAADQVEASVSANDDLPGDLRSREAA